MFILRCSKPTEKEEGIDFVIPWNSNTTNVPGIVTISGIYQLKKHRQIRMSREIYNMFSQFGWENGKTKKNCFKILFRERFKAVNLKNKKNNNIQVHNYCLLVIYSNFSWRCFQKLKLFFSIKYLLDQQEEGKICLSFGAQIKLKKWRG